MTVSELVMLLKPKVDEQSQQQAKNSIRELNNAANGLRSVFTKALAVLGIGLSLRSMNALIESFNNANDSIRGVIDSSEDLAKVTDDIRRAANEARVPYEQLASTVEKTASLEMFNTEEAIQYSTNLSKLLTSRGHGDQASGVQMRMNRMMQGGQLGTSITRMFAQTPEVLELLEKHLDVDREKLLEMAKAGKITAETVKEAFLNSTEYINEEFAKTDIMFTDALKVVRNNWGFFLNELNDATGIGNELGHLIVDASNKIHDFFMKAIPYVEKFTKAMGGSRNMLKLFGITLASLGAAGVIGNFGKITDVMGKAAKALGLLNAQGKVALLQMGKIILIVAAILLVIDDLVNFMKGNDSLLGVMCEKAGIDAEKLRETIKGIWEKIREIGTKIFEIAKKLWDALSPIILKAIDIVGVVFAEAINILAGAIDGLVGFISKLVDWIAIIVDWVTQAIGAIGGVAKEIGELMGMAIEDTCEFIAGGLEKIVGWLSSAWEFITGIINAIKGGSLGQWISEAAGAIGGFFGGVFGGGGQGESARYLEQNSTTNTTNNNTSNVTVNNTFNGTDRGMANQAVNAVNNVLNSSEVARLAKVM